MSIQVLCPFFNWVTWFFCLFLSCRSSLYILDINPLSNIWFAIFSLILQVAFPLCYYVLWWTKVFKFYVVRFIYFCFSCLCFLVSYPRNHCQIQCHEAFSLRFLPGVLSFCMSPAQKLTSCTGPWLAVRSPRAPAVATAGTRGVQTPAARAVRQRRWQMTPRDTSTSSNTQAHRLLWLPSFSCSSKIQFYV